MKSAIPLNLQLFAYFGAALAFLFLRLPLLPAWWVDLHADFALVGIMAMHTKAGHFPVYFYGQNYMGGLEWLTAAFFSLLFDKGPEVSLEVLRGNSLLWWLAAGTAWVFALRHWSVVCSLLFAWLFAFGSYHLQKVSLLQELSPQYLFFGALCFHLLGRRETLRERDWFVFGLVLGMAWWTNQSVVFFLLPALLLFQAIPHQWHRQKIVRDFFTPVKKARFLYILAAITIPAGILIAVFGGLHLSWIKIPNGISLARDSVMLLAAVQGIALAVKIRGEWRRRIRPFLPFASAFLLGFSPSWLGRILGFYEKGYGVGLAIVPYWKWQDQILLVIRNTADLLFSGRWIPALAALMVVGGGIVLGAHRQERMRRLLLFCLAVILLNGLYVAFSARSAGAPHRYLYPSHLAMLLALTIFATQGRNLAARALLVLLLLVSLGTTGINSRLKLQLEAEDSLPRKRDLEYVTEVLGRDNIHLCWGDYWSSYLFAFLSGERTIVAPHPSAPHHQVRVRSYQEKVAAGDPACFLVRENDAATARIYLTDRNPWVKP